MKKKILAQIDFDALRGALPARPDSLVTRSDLKVGVIISELLPYLFVLAGLALLVYLIYGGFQLMTSGGDPKAMESAKGKITNAIVGFIIIFVAYWLMQILQIIFGFPGPF